MFASASNAKHYRCLNDYEMIGKNPYKAMRPSPSPAVWAGGRLAIQRQYEIDLRLSLIARR
jgi:hypothetical protein